MPDGPGSSWHDRAGGWRLSLTTIPLGCQLGQGYLIASPTPAEEMAAWLMERAASVLAATN